MKKIFEFKAEREEFELVNMNPNEKQEAFKINKKEMQFDTNKFYQYVFSDITTEMQIDIIDKTDESDKLAKRVHSVISEIVSGVMQKLNEHV